MSQSNPPVIGFLSDFGTDGAAAVCHGVILGICPEARVIDISHTIPKFDIRAGAYVLRTVLPYLPVGVHLAVVDPGVGTERRPIAIRAGRGDLLIGPDNGLLLPAADALGGATEARELTNHDLWRPTTSHTFHGRDIFAPVAAHLAAGDATVAAVGGELRLADLVSLPGPIATVASDRLETVIEYVDSFGNARLAGDMEMLTAAFSGLAEGDELAAEIDGGTLIPATFVRTFGAAAPGVTVLYVDSAGSLALGVNQGDFAGRSDARAGQRVVLRRG